MPRFDDIDHVGQLRPIGFEKLMRDEATTVEIHHGGEQLLEIDASHITVSRPRMNEKATSCRVRFGVDAMTDIEAIESDEDESEEDDDRESESGEDDGEPIPETDEGDKNTNGSNDDENDSGYDTDGKMTFTMTEGPEA